MWIIGNCYTAPCADLKPRKIFESVASRRFQKSFCTTQSRKELDVSFSVYLQQLPIKRTTRGFKKFCKAKLFKPLGLGLSAKRGRTSIFA
ncbi:hypothetical protein B9G53_22725 [Pseudanabaena sp. SR411]|nr:hypothetical protein B9G53_22725 [Pseudanabaena sp. SR411]